MTIFSHFDEVKGVKVKDVSLGMFNQEDGGVQGLVWMFTVKV